MHIPNLSDPSTPFFQKIPLSLQPETSLSSIFPEDIIDDGNEEIFIPSPILNQKVSLWTGDLTLLQVDAITNPSFWNFSNDGTGISGLIHFRSGEGLKNECYKIGACQIGKAVITNGYNLQAKKVIHCVPPSYRPNHSNLQYLRSCYESCLELLIENNLRTIGFSCLGTGSKFGNPITDSAHIALRTVRKWLEKEENYSKIDRIIFSVKNARQQEIYEQLMRIYFPIPIPQDSNTPILSESQISILLSECPSPPK